LELCWHAARRWFMGIQSSSMVTIWCKCEAVGGMGIE